jgi:hypothetical protein
MEFDLADADSSQYLSINDRFYVDVEYSIKDSCRVYFPFAFDLLLTRGDPEWTAIVKISPIRSNAFFQQKFDFFLMNHFL